VFQVKSIRLNLYNEKALCETDFKETGIARFALTDSIIQFKMLGSGASEAEVVLQTFMMTNTKPGRSWSREIILAEKNCEQVMILYSSSGAGSASSSFAVVMVDSPKILFALDPVFALLSFFTSAFPPVAPNSQSIEMRHLAEREAAQSSAGQSQFAFAFRFDLHNTSITVLEDDEQLNSQAIWLAIKQISLSPQASVFHVRVQLMMTESCVRPHRLCSLSWSGNWECPWSLCR
jgi:vacuolar protein sorting-associated protein 13A/C